MSLTDVDKAVLVLATRLGDASRPSYSPAAWHALAQSIRDSGGSLVDVFTDVDRLGLRDEDRATVTSLVSDGTAAMLEANEWERRGIWAMTIESDDYPDRLRRRLGPLSPPVLFGAGSRDLLHAGGVAIVGSRNVTDVGGQAARDVAAAAASLGRTVVSGAARGVDQLAMDAAYESGGSVVGVLADALERRVRSRDVLDAIDRGDVCLVTQQHPSTGFSAGAAMGRNKIVYALADVTVVVATDEGKGGTWNGATEALSRNYGKVAVWRGPGEGPGNAALEKRGATRLDNVDALESLLSNDPEAHPEQLSFIE